MMKRNSVLGVLSLLACTLTMSFSMANAGGLFEVHEDGVSSSFSAGVEKSHYDADSYDNGTYHRVVIDNKTRYLGGDGTMASANVGQTKLTPAMKFPFSVPEGQQVANPVLKIGSIYGINTREAHQNNQSRTDYVSSPVVVKVNGYKVSYVNQNGEDIRIQLPSGVLNRSGYNVVQVESGFYFPETNRIAYDLIEVSNLTLEM